MFSCYVREKRRSQLSLWHVKTALRFALWDYQELCMVPCDSCHIYELWTSRSRKVYWMVKSHQLWVAFQVFSQGRQVLTMYYCCIVKLYCTSYWIYTVKDFIRYILLFTILMLFYVFEVSKTKSATQSVLMILKLNGLFQKNIQVFYLTLGNSRQNKAPSLVFHKIVLHSSEILRPKIKTHRNST